MSDPVFYDKNGHAVKVGDLIIDQDGVISRVNGFANIPNAGTFAYYNNQIELAPPGTDPPNNATSSGDSIVWSS